MLGGKHERQPYKIASPSLSKSFLELSDFANLCSFSVLKKRNREPLPFGERPSPFGLGYEISSFEIEFTHSSFSRLPIPFYEEEL